MKNLLNVKGTQELSKKEQQAVNGGARSNACISFNSCQTASDCHFFATSAGNVCAAQCNQGKCIGIPL